jgi:hypothetical protein
MTQKNITNVREFVWKIIDTDVALKKDISRNLINIRGLANYIIKEHRLNVSIDSIVSAIRRYHTQPLKKADANKVYNILKQAKIGTVTKIASLSLKKNEHVHQKIAQILPENDYATGEMIRVIEGARIFKVIFDQNNLEKMISLFGKSNIVETHKKLGMIEMIYPAILEKTPGVFSIISNELGENDISIVDALICANEHIIIIEEKDLLKGFDIVFNLCN